MRRALLVAITLTLVWYPPSVQADPGHARPKITEARFLQPPLRSGIDEVFRVVAHDPDSWISEVQVQFENADGEGGVVFAHTFCVQDPDYSDPGTVAKLKIPIRFERPGEYHVETRAVSSVKCAGDDTSKTSTTVAKDVVVTEPFESFADPDDTPGALDVSTIEQTQEGSETSATTEVVHRLRMFESWNDDALAGDGVIELYFDLNDDLSRAERLLTIDFDHRDSTIRASMLNTRNGQARGYAAVFRPDDRTLELRFPPTLLKEGLDHYDWYATVISGESEVCPIESPCSDAAPDSGAVGHHL